MPLKEKSITDKAKTRSALRSKDEIIFEWASEHLNTQRARHALKRRNTWPETAFADAKNNHGMGRTRHKGKRKVKIQVLLTATVINIKKLVKFRDNFMATGYAAGICPVNLMLLLFGS